MGIKKNEIKFVDIAGWCCAVNECHNGWDARNRTHLYLVFTTLQTHDATIYLQRTIDVRATLRGKHFYSTIPPFSIFIRYSVFLLLCSFIRFVFFYFFFFHFVATFVLTLCPYLSRQSHSVQFSFGILSLAESRMKNTSINAESVDT